MITFDFIFLLILQIITFSLFCIGMIYFFKKIFRVKVGKIELVSNPRIKKDNYENIDEFKFNKKTNLVPKKKNRLFCLFFSEDRGAYFIIRSVKKNDDYFIFKKGLYIIDNESIHITTNGARISFYLEGISTPIKMSNIQKVIETISYTDLYGNKRKSTVEKIKGLKFDSKILNTFTDRKFAELFTKQPVDNFQFFLLIFGIVIIILTIINIGASYFFR